MTSDTEQQSEILAALFDQSADLLVQTNMRGEITFVSSAARCYGYDPLDVVGTSGLQLLHPKDRANAAKNSVDVLSGVVNRAANRQHRLLKRDGGYAWVEGNPVIQRDADGQIVGFVNVFRDITERRKVDAKVLRQAALLEKVFESSPTAKLIMTLRGDIVRANPAFCGFVDRSPRELVGKPALDFIDRDYANWDPGETRLLRSGSLDVVRRDFRFLRGDGEYAIGDAIVSIVRDAAGRPWRLVAQIVDVTESRRLQTVIADRDAQFRLVVENSRDVIVRSDRRGRLVYVSPSIRDLGFEPTELRGKTFAEHIHPDDIAAGKNRLQSLDPTGAGAQFRWRLRHAQTGAWVWMESSLVPILNPVTGQQDGILDVVRNIDTQVAQEVALGDALSEAERLSSVKSEFLSNMNHELRTPITTILGFCDLLTKRVPELGIENDYLSRIRKAGFELVGILDSIMYIFDNNKSDMQSKKANINIATLGCISDEIFSEFVAQSASKGLILHVEESDLLCQKFLIDQLTLTRILRHLVSNAVKFSESGTITLRVGVEAGSDDCLFFEIEDQGPGISVDQQARIFEPFTQVDSSVTRRHNGVGLGLTICRDLAARIGGRIELHSDPGAGSCFRLIFPARVADSAIETSSDHEGRPLEAVRALVVDDNDGNRQMFGLMLAALGADVSMAENGQVAVDMCQANFFEVVLMDIHMPVLDGPGALRAIREGPGPNADTPVIAFTAGEGGGDLRSLADFDGIVRKPVQAASLVEAIYAALSGAPQSVDGVADYGR